MAINYETFKDGGFKYALIKLKNIIDTLLATKYDKTGGNISGNVDIDGNLTLNIPDDDYTAGIRFSKELNDNLGTVLTLTGFANAPGSETNYKPVIRNVARPNANFDVANKIYVDEHIVTPNYHLVELNPDGTVHLSASSLVYSTILSNLTNPYKADYLDIFWEYTRFYAKAIEVTDVNTGDIKFIADIEYQGILRHMIFTLNPQSVLTTTSITTAEIVSNKKPSVVNNISNDAYPTTSAVYNEFMRKPVVVWEESTPANYLKAITANISANPAWQLTDLDMTQFKRIKIYSCAGQASGSTASASTTAAIILEMSLDPRAAIAAYGGNYVGSIISQKPNDNNRLATLTCAVSADKTKFVVLRQTNLYGTAASNNNDVNANVFMIEGYYD